MKLWDDFTVKYAKVHSLPIASALLGHSSNPGWMRNFVKTFSFTKDLSHDLCTITIKRPKRFVSLIWLRGTPNSWQRTSIPKPMKTSWFPRKLESIRIQNLNVCYSIPLFVWRNGLNYCLVFNFIQYFHFTFELTADK